MLQHEIVVSTKKLNFMSASQRKIFPRGKPQYNDMMWYNIIGWDTGAKITVLIRLLVLI